MATGAAVRNGNRTTTFAEPRWCSTRGGDGAWRLENGGWGMEDGEVEDGEMEDGEMEDGGMEDGEKGALEFWFHHSIT